MTITEKDYDKIVKKLAELPYKDNITNNHWCTHNKQDDWASYLFSRLFDPDTYKSTYLPTLIDKFMLPSDTMDGTSLFLSVFKKYIYKQIYQKFVRYTQKENKNIYLESELLPSDSDQDLTNSIFDEEQLNTIDQIDTIKITTSLIENITSQDLKDLNTEFLDKCDHDSHDIMTYILSGTKIDKIVSLHFNPSHKAEQALHNKVRKCFNVNEQNLNKSYSDSYSNKIVSSSKDKYFWKQRRVIEKKINNLHYRLLLWYKFNGIIKQEMLTEVITDKYQKMHSKFYTTNCNDDKKVLEKFILKGW